MLEEEYEGMPFWRDFSDPEADFPSSVGNANSVYTVCTRRGGGGENNMEIEGGADTTFLA